MEENKPEVKPYDLTNQDRIIRGRMPLLDVIYENFVRGLRLELNKHLRQLTTVSMISTDLVKYGEFVNTLPLPTYAITLKSKTIKKPLSIFFEQKLFYTLINCLCGGTNPEQIQIESKDITNTEKRLIKPLNYQIQRLLNESFGQFEELNLSFEKEESNPQFLGLSLPNEVVILTTFVIETEAGSGWFIVAIPYSTVKATKTRMNQTFSSLSDSPKIDLDLKTLNLIKETYVQLEPITFPQLMELEPKKSILPFSTIVHEKINGKVVRIYEIEKGEPMKEITDLKKGLNFIPLKVEVKLGETIITGEEVLKLQEGSVIALDKLIGESMGIYVQGKLIGAGEVVVVDDKYGIRITDLIQE